MENLRILIGAQDFRQVLTVGIGDKYLPELVALNHLNNALHPLAVQSVKNIVQQKDGLIRSVF